MNSRENSAQDFVSKYNYMRYLGGHHMIIIFFIRDHASIRYSYFTEL